jgi:hypothetical protein
MTVNVAPPASEDKRSPKATVTFPRTIMGAAPVLGKGGPESGEAYAPPAAV